MLLDRIGVTDILGILCPAMSVARGIPQAIRILCRRSSGVSSGTWLLALLVAQVWCAYGLVFHVPAEVAANVPNAICSGLIVYATARKRGAIGRDLLLAIGITLGSILLTLACLMTGANWWLSLPAVTCSLCFFLPQLWKVFRESDLAGVSIVSWLLGFVTALAWGVYGLLIRQAPIWIPSTVMIPSATLIIIRLLSPSQRLNRRDAAL